MSFVGKTSKMLNSRIKPCAVSFLLLASSITSTHCIIIHPTLLTPLPDPGKQNAVYQALDSAQITASWGIDDFSTAEDQSLSTLAANLYGSVANQNTGKRKYDAFEQIGAFQTALYRICLALPQMSRLQLLRLSERLKNLANVQWTRTTTASAIGIDPIMIVYGMSHLEAQEDESGTWMYDDWSNTFIPQDDLYHACNDATFRPADVPAEGYKPPFALTETYEVDPDKPSLALIFICAAGMEALRTRDPAATLTTMLNRGLAQQLKDVGDDRSIDRLRFLDFLLLHEILHAPAVLDGLQDTDANGEVYGYDPCKAAKDPKNAGEDSVLHISPIVTTFES